MRRLRLSLVGTVTLALLGGLGGVVMAQSGESEEPAFPTGSFVAAENPNLLLEFYEDGTGFAQDAAAGVSFSIVWATNGNLYTEMANDAGVPYPATYYWDFDGEHLTMELWGMDLERHRNFWYADNTLVLVEDPVLVAVAAMDFEAGDAIPWGVTLGFAPAAEAGPDAYTRPSEVSGRVAAVPISKGQPITPDMLEPAE